MMRELSALAALLAITAAVAGCSDAAPQTATAQVGIAVSVVPEDPGSIEIQGLAVRGPLDVSRVITDRFRSEVLAMSPSCQGGQDLRLQGTGQLPEGKIEIAVRGAAARECANAAATQIIRAIPNSDAFGPLRDLLPARSVAYGYVIEAA